MAKELVLNPGEILFKKGDEFNKMVYLLEDGALEVFHISEDGREVLVGHIHPGELVGEMSMIDGSTRSATCKAKFLSKLSAINQADYEREIQSWPVWYSALIKTLLDRLRKANSRVKV